MNRYKKFLLSTKVANEQIICKGSEARTLGPRSTFLALKLKIAANYRLQPTFQETFMAYTEHKDYF